MLDFDERTGSGIVMLVWLFLEMLGTGTYKYPTIHTLAQPAKIATTNHDEHLLLAHIRLKCLSIDIDIDIAAMSIIRQRVFHGSRS